MTRREFFKLYDRRRREALPELYKGSAHATACIAASICEIPEESERLWRKLRPTLKGWTVAELEAKWAGDTPPTATPTDGGR